MEVEKMGKKGLVPRRRGKDGLHLCTRHTFSTHRFSLGSPFLAHFFFKHRPHNTYTRREHATNMHAWCERGRAKRSSRLNYRLYVFKWSAVCIFIKARERQARFTPLSSFPPSPLRTHFSRTAPSIASHRVPFRRPWVSTSSFYFRGNLLYRYLSVFT